MSDIDEFIRRNEKLRIQNRIEKEVKTGIVRSLQDKYSMYDSDNPASKNEYIDSSQPGNIGAPGMKKEEPFKGVIYDVPDYEKIFSKRNIGPGYPFPAGVSYNQPIKDQRVVKKPDNGARIAHHDVFFSREDYENGYLTKEQFEKIGGNSRIYVPFFFEDLRMAGRRIYFRAFLTSFQEKISPKWSKDFYYGRVDPVPIYKNTERTFSVSFTIASFSPAGFSTLWKKVNHISKMQYPTYDSSGILSKTPACRIRIGDVMAQGNGQGLPGFIDGDLSFDYSDAPWEITQKGTTTIPLGMAPMWIKASFVFQVIHEKNPEVSENYSFDTSIFRGLGDLPAEVGEGIDDAEENPSTEVEDGSISDGQGPPEGISGEFIS